MRAVIAALCCVLFVPAGAAADAPPTPLTIEISVQAGTTQALVAASRQAAVESSLSEHFTAIGFADINTQWCAAQRCQGTHEGSAMSLQVQLGAVREGGVKRGLSFALGDVDPRAPGFNRTSLLPMACRLRDRDNQLIAVRDHEVALGAAAFEHGDLAATELAAAISSGCRPLLIEHVRTAAVTAAAGLTPTRGVFLERREAGAARVLSSTAALADTGGAVADTAASPDKPPAQTVSAARLEKQSAGARTQYVLHNYGHTLYLEFGPGR